MAKPALRPEKGHDKESASGVPVAGSEDLALEMRNTRNCNKAQFERRDLLALSAN